MVSVRFDENQLILKTFCHQLTDTYYNQKVLLLCFCFSEYHSSNGYLLSLHLYIQAGTSVISLDVRNLLLNCGISTIRIIFCNPEAVCSVNSIMELYDKQ